MNSQQITRQRATDRRRHERAMGLKAEHWIPIKARGIAPLRLYRVEGTYKLTWAQAFEVRHPCGVSHRYATLREAKAFAVQQLSCSVERISGNY